MSFRHVVIYPSDSDGCGHYRMMWPGKALLAKGFMVTVQPRRPPIVVNDMFKPPKVVDISVGNASIVVFQRPASYQIAQLIPVLHKKGVKVIIDMDDDLSCIHPTNPCYKIYHPKYSPFKNYELAAEACDLADWVTVTTPALAERYGSHGRCSIVPNCVPARYLDIPKVENEGPVVGWAGWVQTHPQDLQITHGAINEAMSKTNARFMAIGDPKMFTMLGIRPQHPHTRRPFVNIKEYPKELARLDIGLVPLANSEFNNAKSWLKAIEYASLGVVPVVTPTPDNQRLIDLGAALPATTPREWKDTVRELILDHEKRSQLSKHCREVAAQWTIEGNTHLWWNAWSNAVSTDVLVS